MPTSMDRTSVRDMRAYHTMPHGKSVRRIRVAQHIANQDVAVVALQEALLRQVNDLQELLGDEWTWVRAIISTPQIDDSQVVGRSGPGRWQARRRVQSDILQHVNISTISSMISLGD